MARKKKTEAEAPAVQPPADARLWDMHPADVDELAETEGNNE